MSQGRVEPEGDQVTFYIHPSQGGPELEASCGHPLPQTLAQACVSPTPGSETGEHIHASATPSAMQRANLQGVSWGVARPQRIPLPSPSKPQRRWEKTRPQTRKWAVGGTRQELYLPLLLPSEPTQPHVTRGPQHPRWGPLGATASHQGPGISILPSPPKVRLGPETLQLS